MHAHNVFLDTTMFQFYVKFQAKIERTYEVDCYFPMHGRNLVTLYQDAHCLSNMPQFAMVRLLFRKAL